MTREPTHSPAPPHQLLVRLAAALGVVAVLAQIAYPLVDGEPLAAENPALVAVTVISVLAFAAASLTHATAAWGLRGGLVLLVVAGGTGLAAETVGVATGVPFGQYGYAATLGPQVLSVPVVVPLAWVMMSYPCLLAGRVVARHLRAGWLAVPAAAWLLTSWDVFLDPQMVHAGHWTWAFPEPSLPGVEGIPVTNYAGWLLVSLLIQGGLHLGLPRADQGPEAGPDEHPVATAGMPLVPAALLAWTWLGSALANVAFFGRPGVGVLGLAAMGLVAGPALALTWRSVRHRGTTAPPPTSRRADVGQR